MPKQKKEEIKETVDVLDIKNDLVKYIDEELEKKVDSVFNQKIRKEFIEEIDKSNRKLLKEKNKKILTKNIIIILLLIVIGYLLYLLYDVNYFDRFFKGKNPGNNIVIKEPTNQEEKENKPSLESLKNEYSSLLNNIIIGKNSKYKEDFYNGNLSEELKKYLALNTMNFESIEVEEDYNIIPADTFKIAYNKLFEGKINNSNFEYNGNKVRYFNKLESYITDSILEKDIVIPSREIIDIKLENDNIYITTIEGIVEEEILYNILTGEEIGTYDGNLVNYEESLNKITYVFKNSKLVSINN